MGKLFAHLFLFLAKFWLDSRQVGSNIYKSLKLHLKRVCLFFSVYLCIFKISGESSFFNGTNG